MFDHKNGADDSVRNMNYTTTAKAVSPINLRHFGQPTDKALLSPNRKRSSAITVSRLDEAHVRNDVENVDREDSSPTPNAKNVSGKLLKATPTIEIEPESPAIVHMDFGANPPKAHRNTIATGHQ